MGKLWSYILPLPIESMDQLKVLLSVFSSEISIEILKNIKLEGKTYQKELLKKLPYSSKTIILKLKQLVSSGVLEEGVEQKKTKGKTVWVKWYTPTFMGKWIITLLTPFDQIDPKEMDKISKELFKIYSASLAELCLLLGLSLEEYLEILSSEFLEKAQVPLYKKYENPDVVVFDLLNLGIKIHVKDLKSADKIKELSFKYGGSAVDFSTYLSRLGAKVIFVGKFCKDEASRKVLDALIREHVGFVSVSTEGKRLPCIILFSDDRGNQKMLREEEGINFSLQSPAEIDWSIIDKCKIVYIGEVYKEVAEMVSSYAKTRNKIIVYRPYLLYLEYDIRDLREVLHNVDVFIIDERISQKLEVNDNTLKNLCAGNCVKIEANAVKVYSKNSIAKIPFRKPRGNYIKKFADLLTAYLVKGLLDGKNVVEAVKYGVKILEKNSKKIR